MTGSRSGHHRKVEQARPVVSEALAEAARPGPPRNTAKYVPTKPPEPIARRDERVGVLFIGEVAGRFGISRAEVERMIASGRMKSLSVGGYSVVVPTSEVERLLALIGCAAIKL